MNDQRAHIRTRMQGFDRSQLEAVVAVLESLDTEDWEEDITENGLCDAVHDVKDLRDYARRLLDERE